MATYSDPEFEPMFADNIKWHNDSLKQKAEAQCGDDHECLFDVASTNDLSVGMVTKDISVQLVNESNTLGEFRRKCRFGHWRFLGVQILFSFYLLTS